MSLLDVTAQGFFHQDFMVQGDHLPLTTRWWKFRDYWIEHDEEWDEPTIWGGIPSGQAAWPVEFDLPQDVILRIIEQPMANEIDALRFANRFGFLGLDRGTLRMPLGLVRPATWSDEETFDVVGRESVRVMRQGHAALIALVRTIEELRQPPDGRFSSLRLANRWPEGSILHAPKTPAAGDELLIHEFNRALVNVNLGVVRMGHGASSTRLPDLGMVVGLRHSLYARCALELLDLVLTGRSFHQCRNCGRPFVKRGRQVHCDRWCASRYATNQHRARGKR